MHTGGECQLAQGECQCTAAGGVPGAALRSAGPLLSLLRRLPL
eukprot:SAG11_NODE_34719_length_270_cov_0.912281_1_plen_42_part_01